MCNIFSKPLLNVHESQGLERLIDVVGHYESFEEENATDMLLAISVIFETKTVHIVVQSDDSLELLSENEWHPNGGNRRASLIASVPWSSAKGKPLMWSWMLHNQQGYFDGLQMEFAKDSSDKPTVIQLVALAGELKHRIVSNSVFSLIVGT